jgi:O-antigen/teichoic acid export membrane protein
MIGKKFLLEFFFVAFPKILTGAGTTGVNLVLLRYFTPEEFGVYSLCVAGILLTDSILGSAIDIGVLRLATLYHKTETLRSLAIEKAALLLKLAAVLVVGSVLALFAEPLSLLLFQQEGKIYLLYLCSWAALGMLLLRSILVHLQVEGQFVFYGSLDLLHNVLKFGGVVLILLFAQASPGAVLTFLALGPTCVFVFGLGTCGKTILTRHSTPPGVVSELLHFVKWSLPTVGLWMLISRLDIFLLTLRSTMSEVGLFSGGQAFAAIPELIGYYLAVILSPRIMPDYREGRFFAFFWRFQLASFVVCVMIYLTAVLSMDSLSPYFLPASFAPSADVILILLPGTLASMMAVPLAGWFLMFMRPRFLFATYCITAPVVVVLYLYAIEQYGAIGAAWVTSTCRLILSVIAQVVTWKWSRHPPDFLRESDLSPSSRPAISGKKAQDLS